MRKRESSTSFLILQFPQPAMQTNPYFRISDTEGVGDTSGGGSLIVHTSVCPVPDRPLLRARAPPNPGSGVRGTLSMASLFNIIICVIQHLPFIYFYLFFWLGNLGSSPERMQKSLSTRSSSSRPPPHPCSQGASLLM